MTKAILIETRQPYLKAPKRVTRPSGPDKKPRPIGAATGRRLHSMADVIDELTVRAKGTVREARFRKIAQLMRIEAEGCK